MFARFISSYLRTHHNQYATLWPIRIPELLQELLMYFLQRRTAKVASSGIPQLVDSIRNVRFTMEAFEELREATFLAEDSELKDILTGLVQSLFNAYVPSLREVVQLWEFVDLNFPIDKVEYGNRINCKEYSEPIISKTKQTGSASPDDLQNLAETLLLSTVETIFRVVFAVLNLPKMLPHWWYVHQLSNRLESTSKYLQLTSINSHSSLKKSWAQTLHRIEILNDTESEDTEKLTVEDRFSAEYRLLTNTKSALGAIEQIMDLLSATQDTAEALLQEKCFNKKVGLLQPNPKSAKTELKFLQTELLSKFHVVTTLFKLQTELTNRILRSAPIASSRGYQYTTEDRLEPDSEVNNDGQSPKVEEEYGVFEHHGVSNSDDRTAESRAQLDEFYELLPSQRVEPEPHDFWDERDNEPDDFRHARTVVLEQLKSVLQPRKEIMKQREETAYKRIYGEQRSLSPIEDTVEDIEIRREAKRSSRPKPEFADTDSLDGGDVVQESGEISFSESSLDVLATGGDFKNRLSNLLNPGRGPYN